MDVAETEAAAQDGQRGDGEGVRERERERGERKKILGVGLGIFPFLTRKLFSLLFLGDDNFFSHKERTTLLTIRPLHDPPTPFFLGFALHSIA